MSEPLAQFRTHPSLESNLEMHSKVANNAIMETFASPNGVFSPEMPEGVSQHQLLKPRFAVDRPIAFSDIKAGDTGVWFQTIQQMPEFYSSHGSLSEHLVMPAAHILSCQPRTGVDGKPSGIWAVVVEAPGWTRDAEGFNREEDTEGEYLHLFNEKVWRPYQRHVWLPLGWGTPEGYPRSTKELDKHISEGDVVQREFLSSLVLDGGRDDNTPTLIQRTFVATEAWINYETHRIEQTDPLRHAYFTLFPKINLENYEGQGDRIPDMPNQNGDGPGSGDGQGGGGQPGDGDGDSQPGAEDEIPPMPGEGGGGDATGGASTIEHLKQKGWWGSTTG